MYGTLVSCIIVRRNLEGIRNMQRKNTFEDFEELMGGSSDDSKEIKVNRDKTADSMPESREKKENIQGPEFDRKMIRRKPEPQIPAVGSEVFEETLSAEERYRQREDRLRRKAEKRRKNKHWGGRILAIIQLILTVVFMGTFLALDVLPLKYFIIISIVFVLLALLCFVLQFGRKVHWVGKVISVIMCLALLLGSVYASKTKYTLDTVTKTRMYQTDKIVIAVLADDSAESVEDTADYKFGIMEALDRSKVDQAVEQINENLQSEINTTEFGTYSELVQALYKGKVDAMIYNQALDELIEENNPGFLEKVRIVDNFNVETQVLMKDVPDLPITKEPFIVYLSGMDVYGELEQTSRSDVNIMACVNPATKQILLVSVPRDAYVEIPGITDGAKDKLTHAGMYGIQYSMASIEEIFDVEISYYVRVNFTSLMMMVDALGGVDVESDYAFSTYYKQYDEATDTWSYYEYNKGMNHLDGAYALAFARERRNAPGGDYQRAKNQQKVITSLLEKLKSPAMLTGYTGLLSSLEGKMDTNLSSQQIASLAKMQLNDAAEWNIVSSNVYGVPSEEYCASYAEAPLSVEVLDDESIEVIQEVIEKLMNGKVISEPRKTDLQEDYEASGADDEGDYYVNNHASDDEYDDFYWENGGYEYDGTSKTSSFSESSDEPESSVDEY